MSAEKGENCWQCIEGSYVSKTGYRFKIYAFKDNHFLAFKEIQKLSLCQQRALRLYSDFAGNLHFGSIEHIKPPELSYDGPASGPS